MGRADRDGRARIRLSAHPVPHYVALVDLFSPAWTALRTAAAGLPDEDFERPSGCAGRLVRDLVCHPVIDAQDVLVTLATPATGEPTVDAVTYWHLVEPPTGEDPLDALVPRLAAAYGEPRWLEFHLYDVGSAAGRAAGLADPAACADTRGEVLSVRDYLSAYVVERTLHQLDLIAHVPSAPEPPAETLAAARALLEKIAGAAFPAALPESDAPLIGTGRRPPTGAERDLLGISPRGSPSFSAEQVFGRGSAAPCVPGVRHAPGEGHLMR
ncbi:maleylpyruvate isomerase [Streptomyces broussonetiae]|uniref:Maleylpyruvate isomerase n=1 Tax=Streptomyces broussonetiae TaxID=2686304 RepID=A0A6I6N370_9ACTN|nr:maleylpyruvate isomerase [Streptomyces broussonetiae]